MGAPKKTFNILSLDGGGGKGMYTLGILRELESLLKTPLNQYFDLFYGTSTGSIIATALARGTSVNEIISYYHKCLPKIMKTYLAARRSAHLKASLEDFFSGANFSTLGEIGLGVVATNLTENKPIIFKTLPQLAHGTKGSFIPGFGLTLAQAVEASCSAIPFFKPKVLKLQNASSVEVIDGGFVANNPALYALIDARKALRIPEEEIRLLSLGTGNYPEKYPIHSYLNGVTIRPALRMVSMQFAANSNSIESVFKLLASDVPYCRINGSFTEPEMTTSLFEHRQEVLDRLLGKGRVSYSENERAIMAIIDS